MSTPLSADQALLGVAGCLFLSSAITGTEWLRLIRSGETGRGGLLDWNVLRLRRSVLKTAALRPVDRLFLSNRMTAALVVTGVLAAFGVVLTWHTPASAVCGCIAVVYLLLMSLRFPLGRDGADQLMLVLSLAVFGYTLFPNDVSATVFAGLICADLIIGYEISGVSKFLGKPWRSGTALANILRTRCYGWPWAVNVVPPTLLALGGWAVMVFETAFITILYPSIPLGLALVTIGALFHFGCWVAMGLNGFFFTYLAAYPALIWLVFSLGG